MRKNFILICGYLLLSLNLLFAQKINLQDTYDNPVYVDLTSATKKSNITLRNFTTDPLIIDCFVLDSGDWKFVETVTLRRFDSDETIRLTNKKYKGYSEFSFKAQRFDDKKFEIEYNNGKVEIKYFHVDFDTTQRPYPYKEGCITVKGHGAEDNIVFINNSSFDDLSLIVYAYNGSESRWVPIAKAKELLFGFKEKYDLPSEALEDYDYFAIQETNGKEINVKSDEEDDDLYLYITD